MSLNIGDSFRVDDGGWGSTVDRTQGDLKVRVDYVIDRVLASGG